MAAIQYLDSLRNTHPELSDWYNTLSDLYHKKLWHQLTLKLEQFVALAVFQVSPLLTSNNVLDFEELNLGIKGFLFCWFCDSLICSMTEIRVCISLYF